MIKGKNRRLCKSAVVGETSIDSENDGFKGISTDSGKPGIEVPTQGGKIYVVPNWPFWRSFRSIRKNEGPKSPNKRLKSMRSRIGRFIARFDRFGKTRDRRSSLKGSNLRVSE